jgi:hypothetical protein
MSVQTDRQMWRLSRGGTAMDRTDILNVLSDNYTISEAANDSQSTTMIRLNELHVKAGNVRQQYWEAAKNCKPV